MSMQALMAASQSMAKMQTMQSATRQMQSSANILRIESKQDGGNQKKLDAADELEKKSGNLMSDLMSEIADVNETLKPDEDAKVEEAAKEAAKEEEALKNPPKTDTIALSDFATKQLSKDSGVKPAVLEAVTYDAVGGKTPSTPAKAAPKFEATA